MRATTIEYPGADAAFLPKAALLSCSSRPSAALGDLFSIASGAYAARYVPEHTPGAIPYLRVDNVRPYVPNLTSPDVVWVEAAAGTRGERITVRTGEVIIARTGTLGKAFVVPPDLDGAIMSQHLTKLTAKEGCPVSSHALAAYLNSAEGANGLESLATGSTRLELTHDALARLPVPLDIGRRDHLVEVSARIPALFAAMRSSFASAVATADELFGRPSPSFEGFGAFSVALDASDIGRSLVPRYWAPEVTAVEERLAKEFECEPLGVVAEVFRGAGTRSNEYQRSGIPYVRTSSLVNGGIDFMPDHYGSENLYRSQRQKVGAGDILLSMEGKVGMVALLAQGERCLVKNHIEVVRPRQPSPEFAAYLYAFLSSAAGQIQIRRRVVVQATIPGLGSASREILVPVAPRSPSSAEGFAKAAATIAAHVQHSQEARVALRTAIAEVESIAGVRGD